ncbi:hypothetical protein AAHE18_09G019200 [Arachis hypogaea]
MWVKSEIVAMLTSMALTAKLKVLATSIEQRDGNFLYPKSRSWMEGRISQWSFKKYKN